MATAGTTWGCSATRPSSSWRCIDCKYEGGRSVALVNYSRLRPDAKVEVGGKELDIMQFLDIGVRDPIVFTDKGLASRP